MRPAFKDARKDSGDLEKAAGLLERAGFTVLDRRFGSDKGLDGVMADWICIAAHA